MRDLIKLLSEFLIYGEKNDDNFFEYYFIRK